MMSEYSELQHLQWQAGAGPHLLITGGVHGDEFEPMMALHRLARRMSELTLRHCFAFTYTAHDPSSGLTEREYDHVFEGQFDGEPQHDLTESADYRWVTVPDLLKDVQASPQDYTPWFRILLEKLDT